ncbi:hypothetical protein [Legionella worsleiensis]|uniref:hypothetical protein n=1 Tax=Legionella worsleiensis TaxID=45076 RepID=UPI0012EE3B1B|nr:hypothetical protein [Legionella worsleiensis]
MRLYPALEKRQSYPQKKTNKTSKEKKGSQKKYSQDPFSTNNSSERQGIKAMDK